jgi:hypothetical protein
VQVVTQDGQAMQTHPTPEANAPASDREPISDVPQNLEPDGRNCIEWAWSLLDDGIELSDQAAFSTLKTCDGEPLLAGFAAEYLDEQMLVAKKAAIEKGHEFADVILCCKAPDIDSGEIADNCSSYSFAIRLPPWHAPSRLVKSATFWKNLTRRQCT